MIANNETVSRQNLWASNTANLRRQWVTVHCYPRMLNAPDIYFHKFVNEKFLLRGLYNKSLNGWSLQSWTIIKIYQHAYSPQCSPYISFDTDEENLTVTTFSHLLTISCFLTTFIIDWAVYRKEKFDYWSHSRVSKGLSDCYWRRLWTFLVHFQFKLIYYYSFVLL